jgi:hypothetical protein
VSKPPFVPPDVPAADGAPAKRAAARDRRAGAASYVSRTDSGWRFQWRLPKSFVLAGASSTIRAALGPRSRPEARRLGAQLATLCSAICDAAEKDTRSKVMMEKSLDEQQKQLVSQVADVCQHAIKTVAREPSRAIGLARALDSALTSLRLVQTEIAKGEAGARAVVDNADALSRAALTEVLKLAADPAGALKVLHTTLDIPRSLMSQPGGGSSAPTSPGEKGQLPTFGQLARRYIAMREKNHAKPAALQRFRIAEKTFLAVMKADRPIDKWFPSDLQDYVTAMQAWPSNAVKREEMDGLSVLEILDANKNLALKPLALKTLKDGYVAAIRAIARSGMADFRYRDPFAGADIRWPEILEGPRQREGIGLDLLNEVFRVGTRSRLLDEAMLPLLSYLTSRRQGLLVFMRGCDIREKYGVMVAQVPSIMRVQGRWQGVPVKTHASTGFFVLHDFLTEIGFVDWASRVDPLRISIPVLTEPDAVAFLSEVVARARNQASAWPVSDDAIPQIVKELETRLKLTPRRLLKAAGLVFELGEMDLDDGKITCVSAEYVSKLALNGNFDLIDQDEAD